MRETEEKKCSACFSRQPTIQERALRALDNMAYSANAHCLLELAPPPAALPNRPGRYEITRFIAILLSHSAFLNGEKHYHRIKTIWIVKELLSHPTRFRKTELSRMTYEENPWWFLKRIIIQSWDKKNKCISLYQFSVNIVKDSQSWDTGIKESNRTLGLPETSQEENIRKVTTPQFTTKKNKIES